MPFIAALIGTGITAAAGALGGGQQKQQGSTTPNIPSNVQPLQSGILGAALGGLQSGTDLRGYQGSALQNINQNETSQQNILKNTLASRGLTYSSPLASAEQMNISQNAGQQRTQLNNSLPLLRQQILQQNLAGAVNAFRAQPYGTSSTGSQTPSGGVLGGLLSGLGAGLGMNNTGQSGNTNLGGILGNLGIGGASSGGSSSNGSWMNGLDI